MIKEHDCKDGGVMQVVNSPDPKMPGFDWASMFTNKQSNISVVRTEIPPNFCSWCGISLKDS